MSMTLIAHTEVGSAQSSIVFSSIPSDYTDLLLVYSIRTTGSSANNIFSSFGLLLNGSGGDSRRLSGNGSSASTGTLTGDIYTGEVPGTLATAGTFGNGYAYIPNYNSAIAKSISLDSVTENNGTSAWQNITAALSSTTSAITSLTLRSYGGGVNIDIAQYSSATLYGISAGSDGTTTVS